MNYQETLNYLYSRLPMYTRIGSAAYREDLHNTIALCNSLGNPQDNFKAIHVAGTNGKGSTSHMMAAIFQQAGFKTGLYTSPHIYNFGERIRVNGKMIDESFVINFTEDIRQFFDEIDPSFFEVTVAMAFKYFSIEKVDIAIIETGLGGRLDSTNIITPILSIITNIGLDHTQILGDTLEKIAFEKAGIIKKNIPVVIGEHLPETLEVFREKAREMHAPISLASELFTATDIQTVANKLSCNIVDKATKKISPYELDLPGMYQAKNLCTVLSGVTRARSAGFIITEENVHRALSNVKGLTGLQGRWDIVQQHPDVIYEVAHNEHGIRQVINQLNQDYPAATKHFVLGFVKDKDVPHVLDLFPESARFYFTNAHIPRALSAEKLAEMGSEKNLKGEIFDNVNDALSAALKSALSGDVVMVCGSFFIIAELTSQN